MALHLTGVQGLELILLAAIFVRQEMIHMTDAANEKVLEDKVTAIEADEATLATSVGILIADFKAGQQAGTVVIPDALLARLDALHVKLQGDQAAVTGADPNAAPATPAQ